jgi:hypothetical protein
MTSAHQPQFEQKARSIFLPDPVAQSSNFFKIPFGSLISTADFSMAKLAAA